MDSVTLAVILTLTEMFWPTGRAANPSTNKPFDHCVNTRACTQAKISPLCYQNEHFGTRCVTRTHAHAEAYECVWEVKPL